MSEAYFYHLTSSALEYALPELLVRAQSAQKRVIVRSDRKDRLVWLDEKLWKFRDDSFLPHGVDSQCDPKQQPILLTTEVGNPNDATVLMVIDGAEPSVEEMGQYERVCLVFNGNDEDQLGAARGHWKMLSGAGVPSVYWSQETGKWQEKARA